jgi:hypothetical protein
MPKIYAMAGHVNVLVYDTDEQFYRDGYTGDFINSVI